LLSILSGFLRPTSGTVRLFGHPPGAAQLIGKVSALPQDAKLDPSFTVIEQLVFLCPSPGPDKQFGQTLKRYRVLEAVKLKECRSRKTVGALPMAWLKRVAIAQDADR